jgi:hypothetical protein
MSEGRNWKEEVAVFEDSEEIWERLEKQGDQLLEASTHIQNMWYLVNDMLVALEGVSLHESEAVDVELLKYDALPGGEFVIHKNRVYILVPPEFVDKHKTSGYDDIVFGGRRWVLMAWAQGHRFLSLSIVSPFLQWGLREGLEAKDFVGKCQMTWYVEKWDDTPNFRDLLVPEYCRTIGVSSDGDAYIAADTVDVHGFDCMAVESPDGHRFIRITDVKKAHPEWYDQKILKYKLDFLREVLGATINEV